MPLGRECTRGTNSRKRNQLASLTRDRLFAERPHDKYVVDVWIDSALGKSPLDIASSLPFSEEQVAVAIRETEDRASCSEEALEKCVAQLRGARDEVVFQLCSHLTAKKSAALIGRFDAIAVKLGESIDRYWPELLFFEDGLGLVCHILREIQEPLIALLPDKEAEIYDFYSEHEWAIN